MRAVAAQAFEFLFLQNAQEFGLQLHGQVADFIEEKRAAVGKFEAADFLIDRSGKSAALVAEKFGFEQAAGDGGAIYFHKGALARAG